MTQKQSSSMLIKMIVQATRLQDSFVMVVKRDKFSRNKRDINSNKQNKNNNAIHAKYMTQINSILGTFE